MAKIFLMAPRRKEFVNLHTLFYYTNYQDSMAIINQNPRLGRRYGSYTASELLHGQEHKLRLKTLRCTNLHSGNFKGINNEEF